MESNNMETVEFYSNIITYISEQPFLKRNLVLQGSGALYFCYNSPRKPQDLDFISPDLLDHKFKIGEGLSYVFQKNNRIEFEIKEGPDYLNVVYIDKGETRRIEIYNQKITDYCEIKNTRVSSEVELATDKIVTLHHRLKKHGMIKQTDIDDLEFLLSKGINVSLEQIESKARQYNYCAWDRETNNRLIQRLKSEGREIKEYTIELLRSCSKCMDK